MKILAISGSPKNKGNTNYLVGQALEKITKRAIDTEKIVLSQHQVNPYLGMTDVVHINPALRKMTPAGY
ncbi:MAG: hypothetical protein CL876_00265 [Dehalococcoidales bacterium]|nr:hypothetical protein [Dehalococcoidales bacterium]